MKKLCPVLLLCITIILCLYEIAFAGDELILPSNLTRIEAECFSGDPAIRQVELPDGVTHIGARAFADSGLRTILLPASLTDIANDAFDGCDPALTARVYKDTYALNYCEMHSIPYIVLDDPVTIMNAFYGEMHDILSQYLDSDGFVPKNQVADAFDAVLSRFRQAEAEGILSILYTDDFSVSYKDNLQDFSSCWMPPVRGVQAGNCEVEMSIVNLNPNYSYQAGNSVAASAVLANSLDHYSNSEILRDSQVTIQSFRELHKDQVIIFLGHGGFVMLHDNGPVYPCLQTGESFKVEDLERVSAELEASGYTPNDIAFFDGDFKMKYYGIAPGFVTSRCQRLDNCFVWLGCCKSQKSDYLATAFREKGASVVFGFDNLSEDLYDVKMLNKIVEYMLMANPSNEEGMNYTASEALAMAKDLYGDDHFFHEWKPIKSILMCSPMNSDYRFPLGTYSFTLSDFDDSTPVENALVEFSREGYSLYNARTEEDGKVSFTLPQGKYKVIITKNGYNIRKENLEIKSGMEQEWEGQLKKFAYTITGTILNDDTGLPAPNVKAVLYKDGKQCKFAYSKTNGQFTINRVPAGHYKLVAEKYGMSCVAAQYIILGEPTADETIVIDMPMRVTTKEVVTFSAGKDMSIPPQLVTPGGYASSPEIPAHSDGAEFVKWVDSSLFEYNFSSQVNSSFTLYALWQDESGLQYIYDVDADAYCFAGYGGSGSVVTIPQKICGHPLLTVHKHAFHRSGITEVTILDGVRYIDSNAFYGCTDLTSVSLAESVVEIDDYAFSSCENLTNMSLIEGLIRIGASAFSDCTALTEIELPDSLMTLDESAFSGCSSLGSIVIPEGISSVREGTFTNCESLDYVSLPESITDIGNYAFRNCSQLSSIELPPRLSTLGMGAFQDCSSLSSIELPETVTEIGTGVFKGCTSLASVTLSPVLTSVSSSAFLNCTSLESISIPDTVSRIYTSAFYNCTSLESAYIPSNVTTIDRLAFYGCSRLTIYAPTGSVAETYAAAQGIDFVPCS